MMLYAPANNNRALAQYCTIIHVYRTLNSSSKDPESLTDCRLIVKLLSGLYSGSCLVGGKSAYFEMKGGGGGG